MSCAKTAELVKMPFGKPSRGDPRNHVLIGGPDTLREGAISRGRARYTRHSWRHCRELYKNGWTDRDAIWVMDSRGFKEACPDPASERAIIRGKDMPRHAWRHLAVSCAKMAEPIEMLFELWSGVCRRKRELHGGHIVATWWIRLNCPCAVAMQPYVKLLMNSCYH